MMWQLAPNGLEMVWSVVQAALVLVGHVERGQQPG